MANKVVITGTIYGEMIQNDVGKEDKKCSSTLLL